MSVTSGIEYVSTAFDYTTGTTYTFGNAEVTLDLTMNGRSAVYNALDAVGGVDPRAGRADLLAPRTMAGQFEHIYQAGETFTSVWDTFMSQVGSRRLLQLGIHMADGTLRYLDGKCTVAGRQSSIPMQYSCVIPFTFVCPDPRLYQQTKGGVLVSDTAGVLSDEGLFSDVDPDLITFTTGGSPISHTITYNGTEDTAAVSIIIAGPMPPLTIWSDTITNPATGAPMSVTYNAPVAAGEHVTIDTGSYDVTSSVSGGAAYSNLVVPVGQGDWFALRAANGGTNNLRYTYGSGTATGNLTINYQPRFL